MKNILIPGGAGFVGSNLAVHLKKNLKNVHVIVLDNLKRRGSEFNLPRLKAHGIPFIHGDVRNPEDLDFQKIPLSCIIECSAEPSVLAGYAESPAYIFQTNLVGAANCLELARRHKADFIFLSTSRVYPLDKLSGLNLQESPSRFELTDRQPFPGASRKGIALGFPLEGARSMYGATKLAAEILIAEYVRMYGMRAVINRCGVIAGPWQMGKTDQGVFGFWVLSHFFKRELQYIGYGGEGKQVRDILHIDDLAELVMIQMQNMKKFNGKTYNVGGGREHSLSLREATRFCQDLTGHKVRVKSTPEMREADVPVYITDNTQVSHETGWRPRAKPEKVLADVYQWVKDEEKLLSQIWK